MKNIEYMHSWQTKLTKEQEMADRYGDLLHTTDTADSYEVAESHLYKKGRKYYWLQANGCSCWDGDYSGWELTLTELRKLAKARAKDDDGYENHEQQMGVWIGENLNQSISRK